MTVLDKSVPYVKVLMVITRRTIQKETPLKDGYHYMQYSDDLKDAWCKLMLSVNLFDTIDDARKKWDAMLKRDRKLFESSFLFVGNDAGELVGSVGLWHGDDFDQDRLRVHYFAVDQNNQHQRIGKAMLSKICIAYDKIPNKYPLYLSTQSNSYGAIKMYSNFGFTPYFGAYKGSDEAKSKQAWEKVTQILKEN